LDIYTTSQADAPDSTEQAADPPPRPQRFDERGIALQTIIIMVVLISIAGTVAFVLLNRAGQETARLEQAGRSIVDPASFGTEASCRMAALGEGQAGMKSVATIAAGNGDANILSGHIYWSQATGTGCTRKP